MLNDDLLRFKKNQLYACVDAETENLNLLPGGGVKAAKNRPWEFGLCVGTLTEYKTETLWTKWPNLNVSKTAAMMTGYYNKIPLIEKYGKQPVETLDILDKYLYDPEYVIVTHNGIGIDCYMHNIHRKECGRKTDYSYLSRFIDTNQWTRAWKIGATIPPFGSDDYISFLFQMYNTPMKGVKTALATICRELEIDFDESRAHDGGYDTDRTMQLLGKLVWLLEV